ncbi:hypothetical protein PC129_g19470, partial [Phytophthora cactorum]
SSLGDDTDEEDVDEDSDSEGSNLDENMHEDAAAQRDRVKEYLYVNRDYISKHFG